MKKIGIDELILLANCSFLSLCLSSADKQLKSSFEIPWLISGIVWGIIFIFGLFSYWNKEIKE